MHVASAFVFSQKGNWYLVLVKIMILLDHGIDVEFD